MNSFSFCRICFISFPPQVTRIPQQFQNADECELCRVCLVFLASTSLETVYPFGYFVFGQRTDCEVFESKSYNETVAESFNEIAS